MGDPRQMWRVRSWRRSSLSPHSPYYGGLCAPPGYSPSWPRDTSIPNNLVAMCGGKPVPRGGHQSPPSRLAPLVPQTAGAAARRVHFSLPDRGSLTPDGSPPSLQATTVPHHNLPGRSRLTLSKRGSFFATSFGAGGHQLCTPREKRQILDSMMSELSHKRQSLHAA